MQNRLFFREWVVIGVVGGAIVALGVIAHFSKIRTQHCFVAQKSSYLQEARIRVVVEGEVEIPGEYFMPSGALVKELLKLAHLKKGADRSRIEMQRELEDGMYLEIPKKSTSQKCKAKKNSSKRAVLAENSSIGDRRGGGWNGSKTD